MTVPNQILIDQDAANQVIIDQDVANLVTVRLAGAAGNTRRHVHAQGSASASWVIDHVLGGRPSVTVVDSGGTVCVGTVVYNSDIQVTVNFTVPFSGFAYLT